MQLRFAASIFAMAGSCAWAQDQPPVPAGNPTVTAAGDKFFATGNIRSTAVTLYSVLLGSDDAGRTWREIHPRIRGAGLDHLQFVDTEAGWAAGQQLFPLPRDPFVLLTS